MYRIFLFSLLVAVSGSCFGQVTIPFDFTSEEDNHLIKENDSLKYFVATSDTSNTVVLNEEGLWYKLLNRDRKVIAEGAYIVDGDKFLQDGPWTEKFGSGKLHITGSYRRNLPIGTWTEYYNTGKVKSIANYGFFLYKGEPASCLSGTWQEFYASGRLKVSGFYSSVVYSYKDTITVEDPVTGNKVYKSVNHNDLKPEKTGRWEYYNESGELDRKEDL